jgi:ATP-dependent helicase/nuclease subunit A
VLNIKVASYVNIIDEPTDTSEETLDNTLGNALDDIGGDALEDAAVEALEMDEQAKEQIRYLKSSDLGIIVHKILEYKNSELEDSEELLIDKAMYEILGEDNVNSLEDITKAKNKIKNFIKNYESIEKNREHIGEIVLNKNEVSFLASPLEDRKTMLTGFIDRLEVFKTGEKNIAVITDYKTNHIDSDEALSHLVEMYSSQLRLYGKAIKDNLYVEGRKIDEVQLKLYFLEKGVCEEVSYDDETTDELINDMDGIFGRSLEELGVEDFHRAEKEECEECVYGGMCLG